jgi:small subunit ribosomal protein S8
MSVDSVGNYLTSIRNVVARAGRTVSVPFSLLKHSISLLLLQEGFIKDVKIVGEGIHKKLVLVLKYVENESTIHEIKQVSTPGRRVYVKSTCIPTVIGGLGIAVVTTNKGVITDKQAREMKIGGELICTIW